MRIIYCLLLAIIVGSCSSDPEGQGYVVSVSEADSLAVFSELDSANAVRIKGDLVKAKSHAKNANKLAKELNWGKGLAESYTNLAYINLYESDFEAGMENAVEGLRIAEECNDLTNQGFANLLIGYIYLNLDELDQVLPYYQKSLKIRKQLGNNYDIGYSYSYLGNFYLSEQKYDSALIYHQEALAYRLETDDVRSIADSYLLIGSTYLKEKDFENAMEHFQMALLKYAEIGDKKRLAETYRNFAEVYYVQGNNVDAENFLLQANQLAKETGSLDNQILIADQLAQVKYEEANYQEAYDYLRYHINTYKETSGDTKYRDIVKNILEYKSEKEKKIKQLEFDQKEETQQLIVIAVSGLLLLVVGFLFFVFNRLKITRKQKEIIAVRKVQVDKAYMELESKNTEILDSIKYAKRIQSAILPSDESIQSVFSDACVLYLPKDIVAGDFYWLEQKDEKVMLAAADCTGHGVPGAMVSVVCNNSLNRSVHEYGFTNPSEILNKTRELVIGEFAKSDENMKDGMDIALCSFSNLSKSGDAGCTIEYAGANNPLWIIRKNGIEIEEYKADKQPIGMYVTHDSFTSNSIELNKGDIVYIFSDGFADQFGGERGKKMMSKRMKKLLLSIKEYSLQEQKEKLYAYFEEWRQDEEQIDDVCLLGVRI